MASPQPRKPAGSPVGGEFSNKQGSAPTSTLAPPSRSLTDPVAQAKAAHAAALDDLARIDAELAQLQEERMAALKAVVAAKAAALKADSANVVARATDLTNRLKVSNREMQQAIAKAFHPGARPQDPEIVQLRDRLAEHGELASQAHMAAMDAWSATGQRIEEPRTRDFRYDADQAIEALESAEHHRQGNRPNLARLVQTVAIGLATEGQMNEGVCFDCGGEMHYSNDEYERCHSTPNKDIEPPGRYRRW